MRPRDCAILFTCVASVASLSCASERLDPNARDSSPAPVEASPTESGDPSPPRFLAGPFALVNSNDFFRRATVHPDRRSLTVTTDEKDPVSGNWYGSQKTYSVSFDIVALCSRTANEIYLVGTSATGEDIVERWQLPAESGAYYASRPVSSSPIGTPATVGQTFIQVQGGSFVSPPGRTDLRPTKDQIYVGYATSGIYSITADPEGRFVIVLGGTDPVRTLFQIPNSPGSTPVALYSSPAPDLFMVAADAVLARDRLDIGRVYFLSSRDANQLGIYATLLFDPDNDGAFDSATSYSYPDYQAAGLVDNLWVDFVNQY